MDNFSAMYAATHSPELIDRFFFPSQPTALPTRIADKAELVALCAEAGIAHPLTVMPQTSAEAGDAACRLGLPLIAKWSRPWLLPPGIGLRSVSLLHSPDDAQTLFARSKAAGSQLLLQRWLPGSPGSDWFFHGYFSGTSQCLFGGSGRKEVSWPINAGLTAKGSWQPNIEVEEASMEFATRISYAGALDLDFRRDEFTGTYQLVDVNPRPGAQFRLFTASGGLDIVRSLYLDLTGQNVPRQSATPDRIFVAENYALMSAACSGWRFATTGNQSGIMTGNVETAWFARDDLRPFYAMARASLGRSLTERVTRACGALALRKPTSVRLPVQPPRQREPSDQQ
ncbi:ATP-grasp domain-containing protein [Streptomyces vinaceus]